VARDREIVEAVVRDEHRGPSPELRAALDEWPGLHYWASRADAGRLVLVRALAPAPRERWWIHIALFAATFVTVWMGGALLLGVTTSTLDWIGGGFYVPPAAIVAWMKQNQGGLSFAMALMGILLSHEMGHYFAAKRYGISASLPYFLPAPIELNFFGTFGAFIRLRSPVVDRRQLMDIGAAGPWAGFVVALLMLGIGLQRSFPITGSEVDAAMIVSIGRNQLVLGDSLLTYWLRAMIVGGGVVELHPLAVAGWGGLLITSLNLFPLGQLDGGHILYALLSDRQRYIGMLAWIGLVVLGWWFKPWWIWAGLALVLGGGRLAHPRVLERRRPLPKWRWAVGWASIALFVLSFSPIPILI